MYLKRSCFVVGPAVALAVVLAVQVAVRGGPAMAEPSSKVVRTFGFLVSMCHDPALAPDFESEGSIGVVVQPEIDRGTDWIRFADCDCNGSLAGTVWRTHLARHLQEGADYDVGNFFWLQTESCQEPPEPGAFTRAGPDGWILESSRTYLVRPCLGGLDGPVGEYRIDPNATESTCFVVVTAEFTK